MAERMGLTELLRAAALSGASVTYEARGADIHGRVTVREGKVVKASAAAAGGPPLNGRAALDALLAQQAGLEVEPVAATATSRPPPTASLPPAPEARRAPPMPRAPPLPAPPPLARTGETLPPPSAPPSAPPQPPAAEEKQAMSEPANPFQAIVEQMRSSAPGSVAAGIFSIEDGLMLGVDSSVPDTNVDAMSGSHVRIVDQIMKFAELLPDHLHVLAKHIARRAREIHVLECAKCKPLLRLGETPACHALSAQ
ncbi:MAG: hypothetical protein AAF447_24095, partial [Myxococcota bacterium]